MVAAFGSTEQPTTAGADPTSTANTMAAWVKQYDLDGLDVDYEVRAAFTDSTVGTGTDRFRLGSRTSRRWIRATVALSSGSPLSPRRSALSSPRANTSLPTLRLPLGMSNSPCRLWKEVLTGDVWAGSPSTMPSRGVPT